MATPVIGRWRSGSIDLAIVIQDLRFQPVQDLDNPAHAVVGLKVLDVVGEGTLDQLIVGDHACVHYLQLARKVVPVPHGVLGPPPNDGDDLNGVVVTREVFAEYRLDGILVCLQLSLQLTRREVRGVPLQLDDDVSLGRRPIGDVESLQPLVLG